METTKNKSNNNNIPTENELTIKMINYGRKR